ncbi:hypothetical protein C0993_007084 [Termitomyces sp. T159_Od127]|nr:hypothetical protein C0993_007084 [Termitomyces sp. T159_Od127]
MSNHRPETQPRTYRPTLTSLLSLPFRICNPPPAVGKVRSCGVTPLLQIRLEDILNRKHLPPLGLKDFEEWLLHVEDCPENLYFILWLKEYTVKYHQWAAASKARRQTVRYLQDRAPAPSTSNLSLFYARAKQTFFMPNSVYELDIPSDILAPFHTTDLSNHPDPLVFNQVSGEVTRMLEQSLERFLSAQLTNVGNNRALCGIIAGILFCIIGFVPPMAVIFTKGYSRWDRIAVFPGLWIGLSILLAALNGICLGVYIFGDLRQLRKFELERPPISKPRPLDKASFLPLFSPPSSPTPLSPSTPITLVAPSPPPLAHIVDNCLTRTSTMSSISSYSSSGSETSCSSDSHLRIEISGAYYETESVDNDPYYSPSGAEPTFAFNEKNEEDCSFATTAAFIHPYDSTIDLEEVGPKFLPQERQPISPFNFNALPPRPAKGRYRSVGVKLANSDHEIVEIKSDLPPLSKVTATTILEQLQIRCIPKKRLVLSRETATSAGLDDEKDFDPESGRSNFEESVARPTTTARPSRCRQNAFSIKKQFREIRAVPAFTSLTRILSPVVVRAQWEIVVRSCLIAFVISWIVVGIILAIPQ